MSASTPALDAFRSRHDLRLPEFIRNPAETVSLEASDGLRFLEPAPATGVEIGYPPPERNQSGLNNYLWVIDTRGIPYIIEQRISALDNSPLKHTNLTGGAKAYLGGEMWFTSPVSMYISGGSGRYPPVNSTQLAEACDVFESFGYEVTSLGWDESYGAKRHLETDT